MSKKEMVQIGTIIADVLKSHGEKLQLKKAKEETEKICKSFPLYKNESLV
jgi:glycine hydroxymethyltransferase